LFDRLDTLKKYSGVAPIVYSSSSEVYANTITTLNAPIPTSEEVITSIGDSKNPRWSYAMGKLFGEIALSAACNEMNATGVILRYHNLYGPDMGLDHFVSEFVNRVQNDDISIQGGTSTRSFLYISEAVEATIKALEYVEETPEIFNIGSVEELSVLEASRIILNKMGVDPKRIRSTTEPMGSVHRRCPDINKIERVFGWKPKISFEQGIDLYLASLSN
jgi:nucleoside-diphosphate-sugar epimerase